MDIKNTLLLDIGLKRTACVAHGVTARVAIRSAFAGFDASASHVEPDSIGGWTRGQ